MDLHRLRVVEFNTPVSEKEDEKKYIAEHEECKQKDWKTSTDGKKDKTEDVNQCLDDNTSPTGLSKKYLGDSIGPPGISKKYIGDTLSPPGTSKACSDYKTYPPGTSKKYPDDTASTSPPETSKKDNFARSKSKSDILKIPPKNKLRKRDLIINSSATGLTKLFQDSANIHLKKRMFNLRNRKSRVHHKVENVKQKNKEVHVLFARETPSFIKYCKKRAKNERTTSKKKRDSELPQDIYGFQKSNRSMDPYQYRMSCYNFKEKNNIRFKKLRRGIHRKPTPPQPVKANNYACKHHAMRVLNSVCENCRKPSICYNIGTHPQRFQRTCDYVQEEGFARERSYYMTKDEIVEVSPSSLDSVSISCCDVGTSRSKVELPTVCCQCPPCICEESMALDNVTITSLHCTPKPGAAPAQNRCKKKYNTMRKTKFITKVPLEFISRFAGHITNFHTKKKLTRSCCIKYVFFGLLVVVWSPCLLAVILAWVVMLPLNLTSILKTDKPKRCPTNHSLMNTFHKKDPRSEYQRMCFENYLPNEKKSLMSSAASWYSRTVGTVINTLTSLLKLKKKAPTGAGSSFLPSSHPNPRKRYTLFYADNRGWVMKPLRRRSKRSFSSTRVVQSMQCETKPKLRRLKNLAQKLKKVCPVHGENSYPRHTWSAPEDACSLQGTGPWPQCVCWDKYSQDSPMFTQLEVRHHQCQQVNIPPTFSYPTSGIAFNSADKTINAKQLNSNDIADNIAHEDLAKYHLGQRKIGTLPFGVVFNHPRGTKDPLITNLETFRAHKCGLAGKTLNVSTKCTPTLVIKGLQGQLPKCWTKHEAGRAVKKSPGVHRITSFTGITTRMPTKHISSYRQNTKREEALNCPSGRKHKSAIKNKKLHNLQKNLNFQNECILADIISQSTGIKQANTRTYKINSAHKIQNTSKHILHHKVINKPKKMEKAKPDMSSKCAKHIPPTQASKYTTIKTRVATQKHSSPAKINSSIKPNTVLIYSSTKKHKQSKQGYKYNRDQIPVATQKQSNTAEITTTTNCNKALNCPYEEKHEQYKHGYKYEPHQIPNATQIYSRTADNTTMTNRDLAFNYHAAVKPSTANKKILCISRKVDTICTQDTCLSESAYKYIPETRKHEQSKQCYKYKPDHIPVATQKQSSAANRDIPLSYSCVEKLEPSKEAYKCKPYVAALNNLGAIKPRTANKDILCIPSKADKDTKFTHRSPEYVPKKQDIFIQKQAAKIETSVYCGSAYERSKTKKNVHPERNVLPKPAYKYKPYKTTVPNQKQPSTTAITTSTNHDIALNCPFGEKHEQSKLAYKYKPHRIPNATQMQSRAADNTIMTNRDIALCCPCEKNHEQYKRCLKNELPQIPNATQMQSRAADNTTMTNRDIAFYCPCKENHEQYKRCLKNEPHHNPVAIQMQSRTADNTTMTNSDIALYCPCEDNHEQYKRCLKNEPHQIPVAIQMQSRTADNTTMTDRDIALNDLGGVKPSTANKEILCIPRTADKGKIGTQEIRSPEYFPKKKVIFIQKQASKIETPVYCASDYERSKTKVNVRLEQTVLPKKNFKPKQQTLAIDCGLDNEQNLNKFLRNSFSTSRTILANRIENKPAKQPPSQKPSIVGRILESGQLQTDELLKQIQPHANSPLFGISSECLYGLAPQISQVSSVLARGSCCSLTPPNSYKTSSAKAPPSQQSKLTQAPSQTLPQTQTKSPPDLKKSLISPLPNATLYKCPCLDPVGKQPYGTKVSTTSPKRNVMKVYKTRSKFAKSPDHSPTPKSLPHKCRCLVESLQDSVPDCFKVNKTQSKFPKSPDHSPLSKSLPRKRQCPFECRQDPVGEQPYGTEVSKTSSPPPKSLPRKGRCPVESLQDYVGKKTSQRSRKSIFDHKSIRNSLDIPLESSHNDLDKRYFESDTPVIRNTTRQFSSQSCERTVGTCSVNEPSTRVQYRSKLSRLVTSLRSKLFSRRISKQTKLPEIPTKKPRSVILSTSQVNSKKADKSHTRLLRHGQQTKTSQRSTSSPYLSNTSCQLCRCSNDDSEKISLHTRKSILDDKSNRSLFIRRSHVTSKTSQNPSLAVNSSHGMFQNSSSCVNHQSFSRQCTKKTRYIRKPLLVDKSYSCLSVSKTSQRPPFQSHSSKLECRCHANNASSLRLSKISCYSYPRLSQHVRGHQSKTSEHSSIVMSQTAIECSSQTFSTPKDGMSHQILKTLFKRKSRSKSQHLLIQRNRSQFSDYFNRSQEKSRSEKQSILTQCFSLLHKIPGICRCAAKHLGKTTSPQTNSGPQQLPDHQYFHRSQKPTSEIKQSFRFDPQYSSSLNNYQPTLTAKQTLSPEPHKSKSSSLFNRSQSKPSAEKIRCITDKISSNSRKNKQEKISSTLGAQTAPIIQSKCACWPEKLHQLSKKISQHSRISVEKTTPSKPPPHLLGAQSTQPDQNSHQTRVGTETQAENPQHPSIRKPKVSKQSRQPEFLQHLPSARAQLYIHKTYSLHRSSQSKQLAEKVEKQFDAIPQQAKTEQEIPIIPGKCKCAGVQKIKTERSSNNKLHRIQPLRSPNSHSLSTNNQRFQSHTASHPTRKSTLGTDKQPEFFQHLPNQPIETPASKLSQPHQSQQADIPHSVTLHNSQPKRKKPCKCRSSKHGNEQEIPTSLHKIAITKSPGMSHYSSGIFKKSHLYSCAYPVTAKKKRLRTHKIIQRSEISQTSEHQQFHPNSQIPTNLDKPPPGLLQQYSAELGRTGIAMGGVQRPYPDFNRVCMRYPGHNPPRKQSEPIPGLNRQYPTFNNPPSAPPPKYARDTCFPHRGAQQSPYGEFALRSAYNRRPLRCTPPRQQLPRAILENELKENKKKAAAAEKGNANEAKRSSKKTFCQCLRECIDQTEREAWPNGVECGHLWLNALKHKPCFWIYKKCPRIYPGFLICYKHQHYLGQMCVYLLAICFWSPFLLCGYIICC